MSLRFFKFVDHGLMGYHFPSFPRKLRSALSRVVGLSLRSELSVAHIYLVGIGAFPTQDCARNASLKTKIRATDNSLETKRVAETRHSEPSSESTK